MEIVVELAFAVLRVFARLVLAALELVIELVRGIAGPLLHMILEGAMELIVEPCARGWRRLHRWVGHVTGLPLLSIPLTILLVMALVAGAYLSVVTIGQMVF